MSIPGSTSLPPRPLHLGGFTPEPVPRAEGRGGHRGGDELDLRGGEAVLRRILTPERMGGWVMGCLECDSWWEIGHDI